MEENIGNEEDNSLSTSNNKDNVEVMTLEVLPESKCRKDDVKEKDRRRKNRDRRSSSPDVDHGKSSGSSRKRRDKKRRHRRRSSSRSTSYDSRSSSTSRDRKSRRKRKKRWQGSTSTSGNDSSDVRYNHKTTYDSYKFQVPNCTIMVRGLAVHLTEHDIQTEILKCAFMPKDIRLIRNRDTGKSRGFAFVEFPTVAEATRWIEMKKGLLVLHDKYHANLIYCNSSSKLGTSTNEEKDWCCEKCRGHNFKRRLVCYKCSTPRGIEEDQLDNNQKEQFSTKPTSTIILSNLDTLTTEEGVLQAFQSRADVACLPIKSVKIARESVTSISKGICYVEANCVFEAVSLFSILSCTDLVIDGRNVSVAYAKNIISPAQINAGAVALAAAHWTNNLTTTVSVVANNVGPPCTEIKTKKDVQKMAEYWAKLYAKTFGEYTSYLEYYRQYYTQVMSRESPSVMDKAVSSPSVPSSSCLYQSNGSVVVASGSQAFVESAPKQEYKVKQDLNGYVFDPEPGTCYNEATQCYFDSNKPKFVRYEFPEATPSGCNADVPGKMIKHKRKKVEKNGQVTNAQRISKAMEKWAKTFNEKKDTNSKNSSQAHSATETVYAPVSSSLSMAANDFPSYLEENYVCALDDSNTYQSVSMMVIGENDFRHGACNTTEELDSSFSFIDENKLICLLCKRRFPCKEILQKHVSKSDLHKKNLDALRLGAINI